MVRANDDGRGDKGGQTARGADARESLEKLAELIKEVKICMMTTAEADGSLRSRPMAVQSEKFGGVLWFFTYEDSPKTDEIRQDRHINLSFVNPDDQTYISMTGRALIVHDKRKAKELWTPAHRAWFPDGLDDPKLALLRVEIDEAEYWTAPPSAVVRVLGFAKAMVTGKAYDAGENRKIDVKDGRAVEIHQKDS